ncbi:DUF2754 family protein, partial [Salmonella enterica subsp. enterica serovar Enteritidis]|nr:DUF2754 family protein [Salmonella enterica subsp. enterica serovar Enteritidis]
INSRIDTLRYGVGLVTWIISFWLAGFIIRRREDDEVKDAR